MLRYFNNDKCSPRITFYLIIVNVTIVITANTGHPVLYVGYRSQKGANCYYNTI
jgi:hypothetical protein